MKYQINIVGHGDGSQAVTVINPENGKIYARYKTVRSARAFIARHEKGAEFKARAPKPLRPFAPIDVSALISLLSGGKTVITLAELTALAAEAEFTPYPKG